MLEKYREELKGEQRPLVDFENDMNIRLQREKQESAKSKLRDLRFACRILIKLLNVHILANTMRSWAMLQVIC